MAVVQISRIQIRRGQKNQGSGIPQLAGGEFGWAVDSRELYIGNGSVAEGAPAVGNTKVITEHDDLFTLANTYSYLNGVNVQTGASATSPIKRTLQSRLDEIVNIRSFGAMGDGTDQTIAIQRALDQLFLNTATKGTEQSRVTLHVPAGVYKINSTLYIPPFATIKGDGPNKTKFNMTGNAVAMKTVNSSSTPGNYADDSSSTADNQAIGINLSGFTLQTASTTQPAMDLTTVKNSVFHMIQITGTFTTGDTITEANAGIKMSSLSSLVGTQKNKFEHIRVKNMCVGIVSDDDVYNNHFNCSYFEDLGKGIVFGANTVINSPGQSTGPCKNKFTNSTFTDIDREGIVVTTGTNNTSSMNVFEGVGNVGGNEGNATYSIIDFTSGGNSSIEDIFNRTADLSYNQTFITTAPYVSEIKGRTSSVLGGAHSLEISEASSYTYLFRLPGDYSRTFEVEYTYYSTIVNAQRQGTMYLQLDKTNNNAITFVDDYNYQGDVANEDNLQFQAAMVDTNGNSSVDTLIVSMLNSTINDQGTFNFKIKYIS